MYEAFMEATEPRGIPKKPHWEQAMEQYRRDLERHALSDATRETLVVCPQCGWSIEKAGDDVQQAN